MGNYENLKTAIANVINTNGNNEITGAILQNILQTIVSTIGINATFAGIATPATNPGVADQNIFYLATEAGTYVNFNQIVIKAGEAAILTNKTGSWIKQTSGFATEERLTELSEEVGKYKDINGYIRIYTDAQDRFLWGIKTDGSIEWSKGVPTPVKNFVEPKVAELMQLIDNLSKSFTDAINDISESLESDVSTLIEKIAELGEYATDTEYIRKYVDANGVFLWGIKTDGSIEWNKGIPTPVKDFVDDEISVVVNKFNTYDALFLSLSQNIGEIRDIVYYKVDDEWIYAIVGIDERVIMGIDADGNICGQGFKVNKKIVFSENAMSELQKDLRASGFQTDSPVDWSKESAITLPIPRACAKVNIISPTGLATTKTDDKICQLEYYDKDGNYFKKYIILNAQGSSSMAYIEKNQSIDVFNDEACEESCDITFGNWVTQDSFHLKCYYIDVFRGIANIAYNYCEDVIKYVNSRNNRIIFDTDAITESNSTGNFATDFGDGALCHPDGFPFEMYVNGEYYGLYAWNLKKHRKNYSMSKGDYGQILLDGKIGHDELFGGVVDWTAFELRNPKDLVTMDGRVYDADTNCNELIDATSAAYDSSNPIHVKTAGCKALIIRQSQAIAAIAETADDELAKNVFEAFYDKTAMMVYVIVSNVLYHLDGFWKNWIWTVYDNIAAPSFYDLDSIFGRNTRGTGVEPNSYNIPLGTDIRYPTGQLFRLYRDEIEAMYAILRQNGIISVDNIMRLVYDWVTRVGRDAYEKNLKKWASIPSYRDEKTEDDGTTDTGGMYDSPLRVKRWLVNRLAYLDEYFNYQK